jgi:hypothetical protein
MTPPPRACYAGPIVVILVQRATPSPLGKAQPSMLKEAGVVVRLRQHMYSHGIKNCSCVNYLIIYFYNSIK